MCLLHCEVMDEFLPIEFVDSNLNTKSFTRLLLSLLNLSVNFRTQVDRVILVRGLHWTTNGQLDPNLHTIATIQAYPPVQVHPYWIRSR